MNLQKVYIVVRNYVMDAQRTSTKYAPWVSKEDKKHPEKELKLTDFVPDYFEVVDACLSKEAATHAKEQLTKKAENKGCIKKSISTAGQIATTYNIQATGVYYTVEEKNRAVVLMPDGTKCVKFDNKYVVLNEMTTTTDDTQNEAELA